MPLCEGRATGPGQVEPCPERRNDNTVRGRQGDLMLCAACTEFRFPSAGASSSRQPASGPVSASATTADTPVMTRSSTPSKVDEDVNIDNSVKIVICELLFFALNSYDKHPVDTIKTVICEFFREDEIMSAKQLLIQSLPLDVKGSFTDKYVKSRIGVHKLKNSVDDIFNLLDVIDSNGLRNNLPVYCAANMARIPTVPDEMSDLTSIRYELTVLRKQVEFLSNNLKPAVVPVWKSDVNAVEGESAVMNLNNDSEFPPLPGQTDAQEQMQISHKQSAKAKVQFPRHPVADVSGDHTQDNDGWQQPKKKVRQKNKKLVIGQSERQVPFSGVAKKSVVCVTRLQPGTSTDTVSNHLKNNGINVLSCFDVSPGNRSPGDQSVELKFCSMRVCVYTVELNTLYDSNIWPVGVVVRPWKFKSTS